RRPRQRHDAGQHPDRQGRADGRDLRLDRRREVVACQGTKTPSTMNSVLSPVVEARPSAPPSYTPIWPSAQIVRTPAVIAPGTSVSAVVTTEQAEPTVVSVVAAHGTANENGKSCVVAGT